MGILYSRPLSEEDVSKLIAGEGVATGWRYHSEEWWFGPKVVGRHRRNNLTYICGGWWIDPETGTEQCYWCTPEEFAKPIHRMGEPGWSWLQIVRLRR